MTSNKQKGNNAESLAAKYFIQLGFDILEKNYRHKRSEIDLIVRKNNLMIFVEVKYRSSNLFGNPEDFVSSNQQSKILETADHYIEEKLWEGNIRFDIIAINIKSELEHFEDAFY